MTTIQNLLQVKHILPKLVKINKNKKKKRFLKTFRNVPKKVSNSYQIGQSLLSIFYKFSIARMSQMRLALEVTKDSNNDNSRVVKINLLLSTKKILNSAFIGFCILLSYVFGVSRILFPRFNYFMSS